MRTHKILVCSCFMSNNNGMMKESIKNSNFAERKTYNTMIPNFYYYFSNFKIHLVVNLLTTKSKMPRLCTSKILTNIYWVEWSKWSFIIIKIVIYLLTLYTSSLMHTVHIFIYLCLLVYVCVIHFPFSATNMKKQFNKCKIFKMKVC